MAAIKRNLSVLLGMVVVLLASCVSSGVQTQVESTGPTVQEVVTYHGPKARIAVASFKCKAAKCSGQIGDGLADMLATALFRTGRFIVLERGEGLKAIQEELNLAQSGYVRQGAGPQTGLMEGADILVIGAITAFEPEAGGIGAGGIVIPYNVPLLGGAKFSKKEAYIAADIRLVDVRTGRVINATHVEGKATSWKVGGGMGTILGTVALGGALGAYRNTPMEKAIRVMLYNAVDAIAKMVPENYYRWGDNTSGYNAPPAPQTTSGPTPVAAAPSAPSASGGLVRPETRFKPGSRVIWEENFTSCQEVPTTVRIFEGGAECVNFQNKKWLATVKRMVGFSYTVPRFRLSGDWALEFTFYSTDYPWAEARLEIGKKDSPYRLRLINQGSNKPAEGSWRDKPLPVEDAFSGKIHHVAIQKKGNLIRVFLDGRKVFTDQVDALSMSRLPAAFYFYIGSGYSDIETGKYTLITGLRLTSY